jgi:hypothetical protein
MCDGDAPYNLPADLLSDGIGMSIDLAGDQATPAKKAGRRSALILPVGGRDADPVRASAIRSTAAVRAIVVR